MHLLLLLPIIPFFSSEIYHLEDMEGVKISLSNKLESHSIEPKTIFEIVSKVYFKYSVTFHSY